MKHVLTIAGSDSGGGAGIQADLKTFAALGVYGMSVITAVTAQNTVGVTAVQDIDAEVVTAQIDAIFQDIRVDAVKIGMVSSPAIIEVIAEGLDKYRPENVVLDPVMVSKSGHFLLQPQAREHLISLLLPRAKVITPNLREAQFLSGMKIDDVAGMKEAARLIYAQTQIGPKNYPQAWILVKGGHLRGSARDVLYDGREFLEFDAPRIETSNTHGTGCSFSSAIAAGLACGLTVPEAVVSAKEFITWAIEQSFSIGHGCGPIHHFYKYYAHD